MRRLALAAAVALPFLATQADAAPFQFTFTTTITSSGVPGLNSGDQVTLNVIADNGGTSILSQSWNVVDLVSASLSGGTYVATYAPPFWPFGGDPAFTTDASGTLTLANFFGTNIGNNTDNFGTGPNVYLSSNALTDFLDRDAFFNPATFESLSNWSGPVAVEAIPEPATMALLGPMALGWGLAGLGLARRRRGKA